MDLEDIKRGLRAEIKKRENEQYFTFQCNVRQMCKDVLAKLEEQESEIAELKEERRWRSVSEELPKVEEDYGEIFLVAVETESNTNPKGAYVTSAEYCNGEWYNDVTGNEIEENIEREDCFYRSKITHWMPMPNAPKETDK